MTKKVEEPKLEPHLKYVFLGDNCTKPVIISNTLSVNEENQLIRVLQKKEVVKLVEAGMNCSISDGEWVSVVQIVPKKGGIRFYRRPVFGEGAGAGASGADTSGGAEDGDDDDDDSDDGSSSEAGSDESSESYKD
ncbi:hypothetical protein KIW84_021294 [Lathyrus oleraceus]|uniref:Uncharacterized protein n=1 Tax=Pisum sativum TaxID=3888 RepID=A0A9D4Y7G1_PEA|nr:hypothetical protein KIW84_021294 [Pisum sativum]